MSIPERKTCFAKNGQLIQEIDILEGKSHGMLREWTPEGTLILEARMEFGEYHGKFASWWPNGSRKEEGKYFRGRKFGLYRWYSESGLLLREQDYGPCFT